MSVEFVKAREEDVAVVTEMMKMLYAGENLVPFEKAYDALAVLIKDTALGSCFLIRQEGRVVGYGVIGFGFSLEFGGRDAFLDELYIVAEARGKGIGKEAVQHAIARCAAAGIGALHLEVSQANEAGQRLYRGAGFRERHAEYDLLTYRIK